jgi:uncharacterized protein
MPDTSPNGLFVWYDLFTSDPAKAKDFYTKVVGWETEVWPDSDPKMPYTMWKANGKAMGGVMSIPPFAQGAPPHWLGYVFVPNVDETAKQITALGGRLLHEPMDIPKVGRFVAFADPQGAVLAAFSPAPSDRPRPVEAPKQGEMSWHELTTTDHVSAFKFYSTLFGWEKTEAMDMGDMGVYQMYGKHGITLGGMFDGCKINLMPPVWFFYVSVESADKAAERVTANGGQVMNGPMDVPGGGRIAQCQDPQGAVFAVHSNT